MFRIGIIGDHKLFRKGLKLFVESIEGSKVVLEEENHENFFTKIATIEIDLLLLYVKNAEEDRLKAYITFRVKYPGIKILIVSQDDWESWKKIAGLQPDEVFTKNSDPDVLHDAIKKIKGSRLKLRDGLNSIAVKAKSAGNNLLRAGEFSITFSSREIEIIKLACMELSSIEIGARLFISDRTVEKHRKRIMEKTGSKNFIGVILFALKTNALDLNDM